MFKRSTFFALGVAFLIAGSLAGCSNSGIPTKYDLVCGAPSLKPDCSDTKAYKAEEAARSNPKIGWVDVFKDLNAGTTSDLKTLKKRCDGTTLIYEGQGYRETSITAVVNSPECTTKSK